MVLTMVTYMVIIAKEYKGKIPKSSRERHPEKTASCLKI